MEIVNIFGDYASSFQKKQRVFDYKPNEWHYDRTDQWILIKKLNDATLTDLVK